MKELTKFFHVWDATKYDDVKKTDGAYTGYKCDNNVATSKLINFIKKLWIKSKNNVI